LLQFTESERVAIQARRAHKSGVRLQERRVASSLRVTDRDASASTRRVSAKDIVALLFLLGWCVFGAVKTVHDVGEYRAQQAALAEFATRYPEATNHLFQPAGGAPIPAIPYDPALGKWLIGEAFGYLITLAVVAIGSYRAGRRSATVQVKWITPTQQQAVADVAIRHQREPTAPQSRSVAAERLSVVVWTDRVVQLEKERA
jgi:hypothetical protein